MERSLAIKMNALLNHAEAWTNVKCILQRERIWKKMVDIIPIIRHSGKKKSRDSKQITG